MTKRKYYKLIEKYNDFVKENQHNSAYVNQEEFYDVRSKLSGQIARFTRELEAELCVVGKSYLRLQWWWKQLNVEERSECIEKLMHD